MRIAISGAQGLGKSTLIKDFLVNYPMYSTPDQSYRDIIKDKELKHSREADEETQRIIFNHLVTNQKKYGRKDNVIFDRCPLDNIAYSLWLHAKGLVSKEFIDECLPILQESISTLDVIFYIPLSKFNRKTKEIEDDGMRDTDATYQKEMDNIFQALVQEWNKPDSKFIPKENRAPVIEIFGDRVQRIKMIQLYIDDQGDAIGEQGIMTESELREMEKLMRANTKDGFNVDPSII